MSWIEVKATFKPGIDLSPFVDIFCEFGIENTLEEGSGLTGCLVDVEGSASRIDDLKQSLLDAGAVEVVTRDLVENNWETAWKQFFKPRRVGRRFVVRPTWESFATNPDDLEIVLDPGQAFGTGDHPTTRLCLEIMESVDVHGKRVLDVGCGSGILAIGACLMGAEEVLAIDIDPIAVEVAKENSKLNGVEFEAVAGQSLRAVTGTWDVVISNILSGTLIQMASDVDALLAEYGTWVLSGVILDNWPDVRGAAEAAGMRLLDKREEDCWVAASFVR